MRTAPRPDRRIERTKEFLRQALIELLAEKPWEDISVQDVCDRAEIGRSTFYLHYAHKEELLAAGLDSLRAHLRGTDEKSASQEPFRFIEGLVEHVEEQRQIFRSIIGRRSGHTVQRLFREMIELLVKEDLMDRHRSANELDFTARFVAGGIVEALALWVDTPRNLSAMEIVRSLQTTSKRAAGELSH